MEKEFDLKKTFIRLLLLLPAIYIGFGWYIGLNYSRQPVLFGPYQDIPVVVKTGLLGSSMEDVSDSKAFVMVAPKKEVNKYDQDSAYFVTSGYFCMPEVWNFEFPPSYIRNTGFPRKTFILTGSFSRALVRDLKNPDRRLGSISTEELQEFLKATGRTKDIEKLQPYL